jgi:hypothetical protein
VPEAEVRQSGSDGRFAPSLDLGNGALQSRKSNPIADAAFRKNLATL